MPNHSNKFAELSALVRKHPAVFAAIERADTSMRFELRTPEKTYPFVGMGREQYFNEELEIYKDLDAQRVSRDTAIGRIKDLMRSYYLEAIED